jgi:hypothetical protein
MELGAGFRGRTVHNFNGAYFCKPPRRISAVVPDKLLLAIALKFPGSKVRNQRRLDMLRQPAPSLYLQRSAVCKLYKSALFFLVHLS